MGWVGRAVRGGAAGVAATAAMTTVFGAAGAWGLMGQKPPEKIVRTLFPTLPEPGKETLAWASHAGYGAAGGALYTALLPPRAHGPVSGTLFGLAVWAAGYEGWLPAFGILPPAHRDRTGRAVSVFVAHLVYGWTLGWSARRLRRDEAASRDT